NRLGLGWQLIAKVARAGAASFLPAGVPVGTVARATSGTAPAARLAAAPVLAAVGHLNTGRYVGTGHGVPLAGVLHHRETPPVYVRPPARTRWPHKTTAARACRLGTLASLRETGTPAPPA